MNLEWLQPLENKVYYKVYGFIVESNIDIPELTKYNFKDNEEINVHVRLKEMPEYIENKRNEGEDHYFTIKESWFEIKDIACYRVFNGNEIWVQPLGKDYEGIKCFILGTAFSIIFVQNNKIAIHGGCINYDNKGILFTGNSGAGKSTIISKFRFEGHKFLSDDVCLINFNEKNIPVVEAAYPQQKLCGDALNKYEIDSRNLRITDGNRDKYAIPSRDNFTTEPVELRYLFEISYSDHINEVEIKEITGVEKLTYVITNIYRYGLVKELGITPMYYRNIINATKDIQVFSLVRPNNTFSVEEQYLKIKDIVKSKIK